MNCLFLQKNDVILSSNFEKLRKYKHSIENLQNITLNKNIGLCEYLKSYQKRKCYLRLDGKFDEQELVELISDIQNFHEFHKICFNGLWNKLYDVSILQNSQKTILIFHDIDCENSKEMYEFWNKYYENNSHYLLKYMSNINVNKTDKIHLIYQSEDEDVYVPIYGFLVNDDLLENALIGIYD